MTPLRFDPSELPTREALVFTPKFRGVSGQPTFELKKNQNELILGVRAKMGLLLFKNALDFEAQSHWVNQGGLWNVSDYREINHKSEKTKSSLEGISKARSKWPSEQILDPASLLYAIRQSPLNGRGDRRIGFGARMGNPISIEVSIGDEKMQVVKPLGSSSRKLLKLELLIETPKHPSKIPVFQDGRSGFWIDQETNIPVEISYEVPPIGSLTIALEKVERS